MMVAHQHSLVAPPLSPILAAGSSPRKSLLAQAGEALRSRLGSLDGGGSLSSMDVFEDVLCWPSLAIAQQMTLIDSALFRAVSPRELVCKSFEREELSPNVHAISERCNYVTEWAVSCIMEVKLGEGGEVVVFLPLIVSLSFFERGREKLQDLLILVVCLSFPFFFAKKLSC